MPFFFCSVQPFFTIFLVVKVTIWSFARDFAIPSRGEADEKGMLGVASPRRTGAEGADLLCVLCFGNPHQKRGRKHGVALAPRKCRREGNAGGKPRREPTSERSERVKEGRERGEASMGEREQASRPPRKCRRRRRAASHGGQIGRAHV